MVFTAKRRRNFGDVVFEVGGPSKTSSPNRSCTKPFASSTPLRMESMQSNGSPPKKVMFKKRWFSERVRSKASLIAVSMMSFDITSLRASWLTL